MRNDSFTLKFYLAREKKTLNGLIPIYCRVLVDRKKAEISTRLQLKDISDWDDEFQRVRQNSTMNNTLTKVEGDLHKIHEQLRFNGKPISAGIIKDIFLGRDGNSPPLIDYIDKYYREYILANSALSEATVKNYRATIAHIKAYLEQSKQKRISLRQLNDVFIRNLDKYMLTDARAKTSSQKLKKNTVNKYHTKFKAIINGAINEGLLERSPYANMKIKMEPTSRTFLTKPELERIEKSSLSGNKSLIKVRDVFMFSVYTGLRFTDAINLKEENIEFDGKKEWIVFQQKKTKEFTRIPMLEKAKEIYGKYREEQAVTGYILPRISNQKVNVYLKVIAEITGIKKPITHHVARHTNATTIFLANGAPLEVVSKQLGHSSIKSTQVYAKITNEMLSKAADKIDEILK